MKHHLAAILLSIPVLALLAAAWWLLDRAQQRVERRARAHARNALRARALGAFFARRARDNAQQPKT
ncbi:hypothetical protein [Azohydromonas aeria]|uniref:hypothetical protein n=1 Tax=Azohydromonas aeria TaxID=2590212 RepID=UPI0012FB1108|nr:hypothetical protein [Azohydromonas aeria]